MKKNSRTKRAKKIKRLKLITAFSILVIIFCSSFYFFKFNAAKKIAKHTTVTANTNENVEKPKKHKTDDAVPVSILNNSNATTDSENKDLRKFPFPYNSMLAICSDIDDATLEEFKTYHKFLNTKEKTPYGDGIGLDIGDSFWMYMADNVNYTVDTHGNGVDKIMTYFKGTDVTKKNNANEIVNFIKVGWIDSIHTFGDFSTKSERWTAFRRSLGVNAWETLKSSGVNLTVWINHGNKSNKQNFGAATTSDFMSYQQGDKPKSPYYHTDLTLDHGIKYVWNSINDYRFGFDYPLTELTLRDGKKVWGFSRHTNYLVNNSIDWTWTPKHIHRQLTKENLDGIVSNKQYSIVGQHFGVSTEELFTDENIKSLRLLKDYENNGKILVAKTSRLLNYANVHKYVMYTKAEENGVTYININCINDPIFGKYTPTLDILRGLTFYCNDPQNTVILLNGTKINIEELQSNGNDDTEKPSISIKWFKPDYTDYSK